MSHHESARAVQPRPQRHLAPRRLQFPNAVAVLRQSNTFRSSGLQAQRKSTNTPSVPIRVLYATSVTSAMPWP